MKLTEAKDKIKNGLKSGYIIHFQKVLPLNTSVRDRIPELGEDLFKTEEEAWKFAEKLAKKSVGEYLNFYITDGSFNRVSQKVIENSK